MDQCQLATLLEQTGPVMNQEGYNHEKQVNEKMADKSQCMRDVTL